MCLLAVCSAFTYIKITRQVRFYTMDLKNNLCALIESVLFFKRYVLLSVTFRMDTLLFTKQPSKETHTSLMCSCKTAPSPTPSLWCVSTHKLARRQQCKQTRRVKLSWFFYLSEWQHSAGDSSAAGLHLCGGHSEGGHRGDHYHDNGETL